MKKFGFREINGTYRLRDPGRAQILFEVQKSRLPFPGGASFFVNVGVYPQRWMDFLAWSWGIESASDPPVSGAILNTRLAAPVDVAFRWEDADRVRYTSHQEWSFRSHEEAVHCGRRLAMLAQTVVPKLHSLLDPVALLDFMNLPDDARGPLRENGIIRPIVFTVLTAGQKPTDETSVALEIVRERGVYHAVRWAELGGQPGDELPPVQEGWSYRQ